MNDTGVKVPIRYGVRQGPGLSSVLTPLICLIEHENVAIKCPVSANNSMKSWLVAIALVLVFLVGYVLFFSSKTRYSKEDETRERLRAIEMILENYKEDHGSYPSSEIGLVVLRREDASDRYFEGNSFLKDSWGSAINYESYESDSDSNRYELYSFGPNQRDDHGGGDDLVCCRDDR